MPFVSKQQVKACYAKGDKNWNCHAWAAETPSIKDLPRRKADPGRAVKRLQGAKHG